MFIIDDMRVIKWYVDASFAVHTGFNSHTGGIMMWKTRANQYGSIHRKLNTRSISEVEVAGVDDMASKILWGKSFIEDQGYNVENNISYQDNKSYILLDKNGNKSAGKRSWMMNICYFFITDQVQKGSAEIGNCPTDGIVADFMTKPLQGSKFQE